MRSIQLTTNDSAVAGTPLIQAQSTGFKTPMSRRNGFKWWIIAISICTFYIICIPFAPAIFNDEIVNLDFGRVLDSHDHSWSVNWVADKKNPASLISFLGVWTQEKLYQTWGPYAVRVFGIAGALAAVVALFRYLNSCGSSANLALFLSMLFLLDPVFVQSFTKGRIDGWAIAPVLFACSILHQGEKGQWKRNVQLTAGLSGSLVSLSVFVWPSAVFLFPLVLTTILSNNRSGRPSINLQKPVATIFLFFTAGALVLAAALLSISFACFQLELEQVIELVRFNATSGGNQDGSMLSTMKSNAIELLRLIRFSPILFCCGLFTLLLRKDYATLLSFTLVVLAMCATLVYINRVLYLLPYMLVSSSKWLADNRINHPTKSSRVQRIFLYTAGAWAVFVSIICWGLLAFESKAQRSRDQLDEVVQHFSLPKGSKVLCFPYELYYAGRKAHWKIFNIYHVYNEPVRHEMIQKVLPFVDHVLVSDDPSLQKETSEFLFNQGFIRHRASATSFPDHEHHPTRNWFLSRLHNFFYMLHYPYQSYSLYTRRSQRANPLLHGSVL